jgi:hypothetical protein
VINLFSFFLFFFFAFPLCSICISKLSFAPFRFLEKTGERQSEQDEEKSLLPISCPALDPAVYPFGHLPLLL